MLLPIALQLEGRECLVVGGGPVAARKVASLLECEARVRVVSPTLCDELAALRPSMRYFERRFESEDCEGCVLIFACTNSSEVNAQIADAAHQFGTWCNRADDSGGSDFHGAAVVRRGQICIGISTGGGSPALSRHLKARVQAAIGDEYAELLQLMSARRIELEQRVPEQRNRAALWRSILESDALPLLKSGRVHEAEALVDALIEKASQSTLKADGRSEAD